MFVVLEIHNSFWIRRVIHVISIICVCTEPCETVSTLHWVVWSVYQNLLLKIITIFLNIFIWFGLFYFFINCPMYLKDEQRLRKWYCTFLKYCTCLHICHVPEEFKLCSFGWLHFFVDMLTASFLMKFRMYGLFKLKS